MPHSLRAVLFSLLAAAAPAQDFYDEGVIRTFELRFAQANWATLLAQNYAARTFIPADLTLDGIAYPNVGVRYRGNSSYTAIGTSPKKPFEISLDEYVPGQEHQGYQTFNLNNGFRDPTFVREVVSFWMFRQFMPAPKANFCRLAINGESWGPYTSVQQVNKDLQKEWFRDASGNRYRAERAAGAGANDSALTWLGTNPAVYARGYELKSDPNATSWLDVMGLCDALNNPTALDLPKQLAAVLDVDEALRYLAGNVVVPAVDSYIGNVAHNYYLIHDPHHGLFSVVPWDLNASFGGNNWLTVQQKVTLDPFYQSTNVGRPLVRRMLADARWRQRYAAHVRTLLDTVYDWQVLGPRVAKLQALVQADLTADNKRLYSMQQFADNVTRDVQILVGSALQWIPGLQSMTTGRATFLRAHPQIGVTAPTIDTLTRTPQAPTVRDSVAITATVGGVARVTLYWRLRGVWQEAAMFDDGAHGDGAPNDGVFGAFVPPQGYGTVVEYYAGAERPDGATTFVPCTAGHLPPSYVVAWPRGTSTVQLNELLASNTTGIRDERGEREDWFELVNTGAQTVAVGGMYLTDDITEPTKWRIPAARALGPNSTMLCWADDEPGDGPLHATFKLAAGGEELALFAADGVTLLDHVVFGAQRQDESAGRLFDGTGPWVTFPLQQTPDARNATGACGRRSYSALEPATHGMVLRGVGTTRIGASEQWQVTSAPPSSAVVMVLAGAGGALPIPGQTVSLLVGNPVLIVVPLPTDAQGAASLTLAIPDDPHVVGARVYGAALAADANGLLASNALELIVCPR